MPKGQTNIMTVQLLNRHKKKSFQPLKSRLKYYTLKYGRKSLLKHSLTARDKIVKFDFETQKLTLFKHIT